MLQLKLSKRFLYFFIESAVLVAIISSLGVHMQGRYRSAILQAAKIEAVVYSSYIKKLQFAYYEQNGEFADFLSELDFSIRDMFPSKQPYFDYTLNSYGHQYILKATGIRGTPAEGMVLQFSADGLKQETLERRG